MLVFVFFHFQTVNWNQKHVGIKVVNWELKKCQTTHSIGWANGIVHADSLDFPL